MSISSTRSSNGVAGFSAAFANGIEVHHHQIDRGDAMAGDGLEIVGAMAPGEDAAVDRRVQRLDPAVHHLGKSGHVRDIDDRKTGRGQGLGRAAGRDQLDAEGGQARGRGRPSPVLSETLRIARICTRFT